VRLSRNIRSTLLASAIALSLLSANAHEQGFKVSPAPDRHEGQGPYSQLILREVTVINGTGAPAFGPADIVIEGNKITQVVIVGTPTSNVRGNRPQLKAGGKEMQLAGHYVMPGIIDMHGHIGGAEQGTPAEYVYKLWMGHGITTIRDPSCGNGLEFCLSEKKRSTENKITAPRILAYPYFGQGQNTPFTTPEQARAWVRDMKAKGADGLKCFGYRPDILQAALEEIKKQGMRSACHHAQIDVARVNVLNTARWGLTSMEHWYGLPEALFDGQTVQNYPADYNYQNEQQRFAQAGRLWAQAAKPGSTKWNAVMEELLKLDFTIDPTFTIYQAARDLMRAQRAVWHDEYTLPSLWKFYSPNPDSHGSFFFDWGTEDEVAWKENYRMWMQFVNEYKNRGGRVTVGSDSGFIYKLYGFGTIEELELLREAGFHPLEVMKAATLSGAEALGIDQITGSIEAGKLADLAILDENPLANFKVLYGTGHTRLKPSGQVGQVGGVKYTVKDGIVYDAKQLLADVKTMVKQAKQTTTQ
jgi:hypothetical protein